MNGKGFFRRWGWYLNVEWRYWIFRVERMFGKRDPIFLESCHVENFHVYRSEKIFWLARYIYASLYEMKEQRERISKL